MKKTLSIVLCVLLVLLAVACSPETHKHDYKLVEEKSYAATCAGPGLEYYVCSGCGEIDSVYCAPLAHEYGDWSVNTAGDCVTKSVEVRVCQNCMNHDYRFGSVDPTNHKKNSYVTVATVRESTCAEVGEATVDCSACNTKGAKQVLPKKTEGHFVLNDKNMAVALSASNCTEWNPIREANAFLPEKLEGKCPTCSAATTGVYKYGDYDYNTAVGTWKFYTNTTTAGDCYVATLSADKYGNMSVTAYKYTLTSGTAGDATEVSGLTASFEGETNEISRTLKLNDGSSNYIEIKASLTGDTTKEISSYLGGYNTSASVETSKPATLDSEHTEHNWERVSGSKTTQNYHLVSCSDCGLKNLWMRHNLGTCSACAYNSETWYKVIVEYCSTTVPSNTAGYADAKEVSTFDTFYLLRTETFDLTSDCTGGVNFKSPKDSTYSKTATYKGYNLNESLILSNDKVGFKTGCAEATLSLGTSE